MEKGRGRGCCEYQPELNKAKLKLAKRRRRRHVQSGDVGGRERRERDRKGYGDAKGSGEGRAPRSTAATQPMLSRASQGIHTTLLLFPLTYALTRTRCRPRPALRSAPPTCCPPGRASGRWPRTRGPRTRRTPCGTTVRACVRAAGGAGRGGEGAWGGRTQGAGVRHAGQCATVCPGLVAVSCP